MRQELLERNTLLLRNYIGRFATVGPQHSAQIPAPDSRKRKASDELPPPKKRRADGFAALVAKADDSVALSSVPVFNGANSVVLSLSFRVPQSDYEAWLREVAKQS
jgi:hypothetical protein